MELGIFGIAVVWATAYWLGSSSERKRGHREALEAQRFQAEVAERRRIRLEAEARDPAIVGYMAARRAKGLV